MDDLLSKLRAWAASQPDKRVWSFCDDFGAVSDVLTYAELERSTTHLARSLLSGKSGLTTGDRVLLVFFPGLHFTASLIACLKAGLIAVPVFPPDPTRLKKDLNHFVSIQSSSGATVALTHSPYNYAKKLAGIQSVFSGGAKWPTLNWILVDDILNKGKALPGTPAQTPPSPSPSSVAFLQYTSGSTSEPKGVMITHGNLSHNLTLIVRELKADTETVNVSWLPQYHDMGLIGSYLGVVYCGGTGYYISPISFLKNPLVWMTCMSKYGGTHTQAPSFAYALSARKYGEALARFGKAGPTPTSLNLGSVKHMINAAEPVDSTAIGKFHEVYGPMGLPRDVIVPTYGLAEHTVFVASGGSGVMLVSSASLGQGQEVVELFPGCTGVESVGHASVSALAAGTLQSDALTAQAAQNGGQVIVGCGFPGRGQGVDLVIVDEHGAVLGEKKVGEIWVDSPSKAAGYWNRAEQSEEDFRAKLRDDPTPGIDKTYLRTGDLGFLHNQELFICGRIKDLIIVRGSNHYPQDLERTAEKSGVDFLRAGCSAAFAVGGALAGGANTEGVVLLAEIKENVLQSKFHAIAESARLAISKDHGLSLSCVCLLAPRSILKTTSGKITRAGNKKAFVEGSLKILYRLGGGGDTFPAVNQTGSVSSSLALSHDDAVDVDNLDPPTWMDTLPTSGEIDHETTQLAPQFLPSFTPEQVREMHIEEIASRLEAILLDIASHGPSGPLGRPVDTDTALVSLGIDSMTVVQFKGAVESTFHCPIPDAYMFTSLATLGNFAVAVKHGGLTEEQQAELDAGLVPEPGQGTTTIQLKDEPCCPWFLACR